MDMKKGPNYKSCEALDILRGSRAPDKTSASLASANQLCDILHGHPTANVGQLIMGLRQLQGVSHGLARKSGWWDEYDAMPEQYRKYFVVTKLMLCVSELSESMEGYRKSLNDDHLPHRKMFEVELADALIRIGDLAGALGLDLAGAAVDKLVYNQHRADHKPENRAAPGGKQV